MAEIFDWSIETSPLRIAGLDVLADYGGARMKRKVKNYISSPKESYDVLLQPSKESLRRCAESNKTDDFDLCEYILTGSMFYTALLGYDGFMLHSSAVVYDGWAYLFSAPSGTGKSTHTRLWLEHFGNKAVILNDDKPALRFVGDELVAYGTPWSGKTDTQMNISAPVAGIAFIERAEHNSISVMDKREAMINIFSQTVRPKAQEKADCLASILDRLLRSVPVYRLCCNMEPTAAVTAYEAMKR